MGRLLSSRRSWSVYYYYYYTRLAQQDGGRDDEERVGEVDDLSSLIGDVEWSRSHIHLLPAQTTLN